MIISSVQFSGSVVSNSLRPHELQHARPACPSSTSGVYSNLCPLTRWCHPIISSSVIPFSSCLQSFPALGSFQMSQFFPCPVLTVASWPAYRFLRRQVNWSGIPISLRIFQFVVIHTVKGFDVVNKAEIDVFLELSCFFNDPEDVGNLISGSLPFLNPAWTSGSSQFTYCWSLAWRILSITLLTCKMNGNMR